VEEREWRRLDFFSVLGMHTQLWRKNLAMLGIYLSRHKVYLSTSFAVLSPTNCLAFGVEILTTPTNKHAASIVFGTTLPKENGC